MRIMILIAAAALLMPAIVPAQAHHSNAREHQEMAQAKKKKAPKAKSNKVKPKKEKYMRAAPSR